MIYSLFFNTGENMLIIFSPTKTMKLLNTAGTFAEQSEPMFLKEAKALNNTLKKRSPQKLAALMKLSDTLAKETKERIEQWSPNGNAPAILSYDGPSFRSLAADDFNDGEMAFAGRHFRILSGLYGILRPMDLISPYRLEMQTPLTVKRKKNLYETWNPIITKALNRQLQHIKDENITDTPVLLNLASSEYSKCVQTKTLGFRMLTLHFKEERGGKLKVISTFAKQARGLAARYIIKNHIHDINLIKEFNLEGYRFRKELSTDSDWLFTRKAP